MKEVKVIKVVDSSIVFDNGVLLTSEHESDCCESHYLSFHDLTIDDFEGLEFDLTSDFFERIPEYGIALLPLAGHPVRIPGYGNNNGYYSTELKLVLEDNEGKVIQFFDITECQNINDY